MKSWHMPWWDQPTRDRADRVWGGTATRQDFEDEAGWKAFLKAWGRKE